MINGDPHYGIPNFELLTNLLDNLPVPAIIFDSRQMLRYANQAAEDLFGFKPEEFLGLPRREVESHARIFDIYNLQDKRDSLFRETESFSFPTRFTTKNGMNFTCINVGVPIKKNNGEVAGVIGYFKDLAPEKELDFLKITVTTFFRSLPVGILINIFDKIEHQLLLPDELNELKDIIREEIKKSKELINNYIEILKISNGNHIKIPFKSLIHHISGSLKNEMLLKSIYCIESLPDEEITIIGDNNLLIQAFLNISRNSIEAMPGGGTITFSLKKESNMVVCTVQDTGCGINMDDIDKIFEPFYSAKPSNSGLGLVFAKKIIDYHHGEISVESQPGKGTSVTIKLPAG